MLESMKLLWKDRKRILGMPITFTKYSMSEDRLFLEKGLFSIRQEEILLYRVRDISLKITLGQRIFGVGSVLIQSSDKSMPLLELKNIRQPREVKEPVSYTHLDVYKRQAIPQAVSAIISRREAS